MLAADISAVPDRGCNFLWKARQRLSLRYLALQRPLVIVPAQGSKQPAFLCQLRPLLGSSSMERVGHALGPPCPTLVTQEQCVEAPLTQKLLC